MVTSPTVVPRKLTDRHCCLLFYFAIYFITRIKREIDHYNCLVLFNFKNSSLMDNDHVVEVPLPRSVEELLKKICLEQNLAQVEALARRKLAVAGEEEALQTLREISGSKNWNLSAYIIHMLKKSPSSSPSQSSPQKKPCLVASEFHSPVQRLSFSPNTKTVRLWANPRGQSSMFSLFFFLVPFFTFN